MSGSGVVPRAAINLGRRAVGIDIDPLAIILGRALCAQIPVGQLDSIAADSLREASQLLRSSSQVEAQWASLDDEDHKFIKSWFRKEHANELFALSLAIDKLAGRPEWPRRHKTPVAMEQRRRQPMKGTWPGSLSSSSPSRRALSP
jgi:hypothetical protein